jgi:hypothetical protein
MKPRLFKRGAPHWKCWSTKMVAGETYARVWVGYGETPIAAYLDWQSELQRSTRVIRTGDPAHPWVLV